MVTAEALVAGTAAREEAKAYLRIAGTEEDGLIDRLLAAAGELCEQFTGRMLLARGVAETLTAGADWRRLARTPVAAITAVEALPAAGGGAGESGAGALAADAYALDIDADGTGWVRLAAPGAAARVRVSYRAGLAPAWEAAPEGLRFGIVRLAAHLYADRDGGRVPPAAVAALWRPWRMPSLSGGHVRAG